MDRVNLATVPLFSMLDDARLNWLAQRSARRNLSPGATAAHVGEPARRLVVVLHGTLSAGYDTIVVLDPTRLTTAAG